MRHYKYRALVKLEQDAKRPRQEGTTWRVIVQAGHHETHRGQFFSALVTTAEGTESPPGDRSVEMTLDVLGDDVPDYLDAGDPVKLWRGHDIGHGVITRRLPTLIEAP